MKLERLAGFVNLGVYCKAKQIATGSQTSFAGCIVSRAFSESLREVYGTCTTYNAPLRSTLCFNRNVEMPNDDLSKKATIKIPVGHLLTVWGILSEKLSSSPANEAFTEEEKRAIWGLEDLCEKELIN